MFEVSRFGGNTATQIHLLSLLVLCAAGVAFFALPRRQAVVPFVMAAVLIPLSQNVVLAGLNFQVLRLVILMGAIRVIASGEARALFTPLRQLDRLVVAWALVSSTAFCLLYLDFAAVVNRLGMLYTTFGLYFTLRYLIRDAGDVRLALSALAVVCVICGAAMVAEHANGYNVFRLVGAIESSEIRNGRIRAIGPFAHPLLAGAFGAALVAPFLGLLLSKGFRVIGAIGLASAFAMAASTASSTPIVAALCGALGVCAWPLRGYMRTIRWAVVAVLVALHIVMKAPVWALIGRLDIAGGSSNYHRYELINQTINHFDEWWLVGTTSTAHWGWFLGDTSNQYVEAAVTGGAVSLVLFVSIIVAAFSQVGRTRLTESGAETEILAWTLGAGLFAHAMAFIGVSYWDATLVGWYGLLACILAVGQHRTAVVRQSGRPRVRRPPASRSFGKSRPVSALHAAPSVVAR